MSDQEKHLYNLDEEPMPEGVEAPPPLTHTMSVIRWTILIGMSLFAVIMILNYLGFTPWEARAENGTQYQCPMHPTYIANQPGDCPICGMSLVPIKDGDKTVKAKVAPPKQEKAKSEMGKSAPDSTTITRYVCPMGAEFISDKPGSCPKCGMDLVKEVKTVAVEKPKGDTSKAKVQTAGYVCPMHPEVTSDKPGKCPKCGMNLAPVDSQDTSDEMGNMSMPDTGKTKDSTSTPKKAEAKYVCPMHPEITSDKPGRCPICNMYLEPVKDKAPKKDDGMGGMNMPENNTTTHQENGSVADEQSMSDMGSAPVPGLVPVTIEPQRLQLIGIRTGFVEKRSPDGQIDITGFVTPDETRIKNVNVRISGWVVDLFVNETGQYVKAGEPLLSVYSQDLYQAEQDYLAARDASKKENGDATLADMRQQLLDAAAQRLQLLGLTSDDIDKLGQGDLPSSQMMLRSPFSGYVLEKNVLPGQYLTPDQNLFTIADLSNVWVLGDVYEQDIPYVRQGQTAQMTLTAFPGESFEGKIAYVYPQVSQNTRTMKVRIQFPNPSMQLRPGMYAKVEINRDGDKALVVPSDAVLDNGNVQYAFVVHDGNHFEPREVKTGRASDDYIEVLSGLDAGEQVVTSANFLIDSESRLKAAVAGMSGASTMPDMPGMSDEKSTPSTGHAH